MPDNPRVQQLLDELLDSQGTPESVCRDCPDLLPEVRKRWRQLCQARDELDEFFPPMDERERTATYSRGDTPLPLIPGYEVDSVLGVGGMGVVFRARHLRLNRVVALKMALAGAYAGPHERERFQREAEAIATLRHPNVVQIHDVGDSDGRPYFTMEFVDGGSLAQKLAGSPLPAREAAALLQLLAAAVQVAHANEIIHRDLKPGNILLTAEGTPKVSDFGLARRLGGEAGLTRTGAALGTPSYMAPEQANAHERQVGPPADIYSLGAILYEMLTGRPPFLAESAAKTMAQLLSSDPVPPSRLNGTVPRDLETICLTCLQKEPRLRYVTAAALSDDLNRFLLGEAIAARADGLLRRFTRRICRRPVFSGVIAFATLSTIGLVGGTVWLLAERAAGARAAEDDLLEMVVKLKESSWPEAAAARDRAVMRLGTNGSAKLRHLVDQGTRELNLTARLDAVYLKSAECLAGGIAFKTYDHEFAEAFRAAGLGAIGDDPEVVAKRISEVNARRALITALDQYSVFVFGQDRGKSDWALLVAKMADANQSRWIRLARDTKTLDDSAARVKLIETVPTEISNMSSLLLFERYLADSGITIEDRLAILGAYQEAHPDDYWLNLRLGDLLAKHRKHGEGLGYLQAAVAIRPGSAAAHFILGDTLFELGRLRESAQQFRRAVELNRTVGSFHMKLTRGLLELGKVDEAVTHLRGAILQDPRSALLYSELGLCLDRQGDFSGACDCHTKAAELDPANLYFLKTLRDFLLAKGRLEAARLAWQPILKLVPIQHDNWYGYAELCLFLGHESEYLQHREQLLKQFGSVTDAYLAERTSRASLLMPAMGDQLHTARSLSDSALKFDQSKNELAYRYFLFARGLVEFREGQFDRAINTMRGEASRVLGPAPRLVLAMAYYKTRQLPEARRTLAEAIACHDWWASDAVDQDGWIYHVLRREAQGLILPNLPAFLDGKYQPQDNDERVAMSGECQFTNRPVALGHLYTATLNADPSLANDIAIRYQWKAARAAALAGFGRGKDANSLEQAEKEKWRSQARYWLRGDLNLLNRLMDQFPTSGNREALRQILKEYLSNPDLAGMREPTQLERLSAEEQKDCLIVWDEVKQLSKRVDGMK